MSILIHDQARDRYFVSNNSWAKEMGRAHGFESAVDAIKCVTSQGLSHVELVCAFPDSRYNFSVGLDGDYDNVGLHKRE